MNAIATIPAFSMTDIERVALAIAKGGLFGSKDPNAVLTLCLLAQAEGQHPAVVFRDYHIINGKPAKKAEAMLRDFIASGGKVEWHALTDNLADATFAHPQGGTIRIDWDMKRAQQAGISTPMWKKYPRQMLRSRVISEGVRSVCPSATSGLYEVGEVEDIAAEAPSNTVEVQFIELQPQGREEETQLGSAVKSPPAKAPAWREPESQYSTPSKLFFASTRMERELNGCGDSDMVYAFTATDDWKEFVRIAEKHAPHYLHGGHPAPEEYEGLSNTAARLVREFDSAEATQIAGYATV